MTSVLESSKFWLGDGTFKLSPKNFYQIEVIARTTNAVEDWPYGIQALFSGSHPGIRELLTNLQKDAAVQNLNFLNASSDHKFPKKK